MAARIAMIAITTSSSMRVKPLRIIAVHLLRRMGAQYEFTAILTDSRGRRKGRGSEARRYSRPQIEGIKKGGGPCGPPPSRVYLMGYRPMSILGAGGSPFRSS